MKSFSISSLIIAIFSVLIILVSFFLITSNYYFSKQLVLTSIAQQINNARDAVKKDIQESVDETASVLYSYKNKKELYKTITFTYNKEILNTLQHFLKRHPERGAIYFAQPNGRFFELLRLPNKEWKNIIVINKIKQTLLLDKNLHILKTVRKNTAFDVRKRSWYIQALQTDKLISSKPYHLANSNKLGITLSLSLKKKAYVLGVDTHLEAINTFLHKLQNDDATNIFLYSNKGRIFADSMRQHDKKVFSKYLTMQENKIFIFQKREKKYFGVYTQLFSDTKLGLAVDAKKVLAPYRHILFNSLLIALLLLIIALVFVFFSTNFITKTIKKLIAENEKIKNRKFENVTAVQTNIKEFQELSRSQVEMSQSIHNYQKQLQSLLDAIVQLIAKAIDAKSSYTAGHCERVPVLAQMLLETLNKEDKLFKDFHFDDEDEKKAFKLGAWLHDCGKVTTPEYVIDKSVKLETIYNRIHEIRMRFEVLYRDAYISYLEALAKGEAEEESKNRLKRRQQQLHDDFAFIATSNVGSEFMDESKQRRIKTIAQEEWTRYFDNTLGLGESETQRYCEEKRVLPTQEKLLDDKAYHIIQRENFNFEEYKRYGFKEDVPKQLYNYGEIYNLCIERGTLTTEERYKINEHIIMTIKMLEAIPFPDKLHNVAKYAGTHHEKLDGSGYPRKLTKERLSIPERVMAIADIFEALCASDRPYKKAKTLSQALQIMHYMVKDGHIDGEIFSVFVSSGTYLKYAKQFLQEDQIDAVDTKKILGES